MLRLQVIALPLLLASANIAAGEEQATEVVNDAAFCLEIANLECNSVLAEDGQIPLGELPRDSDGNRIIHFHSNQGLELDSTLVHVWEMDNSVDRPRSKLYVSDGAKSVGKDVLDLVQGFLDSLEVSAFAVVIRNNVGTSQRFRAYSQRIVHGSGRHTAYVATVGDEIVPNSARRSITVTE